MRTRIPRWLPTVVLIAVLAGAGGIRHEGFLSFGMLCDLASDEALLGLATLGASIVLVSGSIDLSVGALMALASVVFALFLERVHLPLPLAVGGVLAIGALGGLVLGLFVTLLELPAFIVTLCGMFLFRGVALHLSEESIAITEPGFVELTGAGIDVFGARLRVQAILFLAVAVAVAVAMRQSRALRDVRAVGGDARAARLAGVDVRRARLLAFTLSGSCSALAGIAFALLSGSGSSIGGVGLELEAIASCVVGGVALSGGRGSVFGALSGVLLFGLCRNLILYEGTLDAGWTRVVMGTLLFAFVALQRWFERPER